MNRFVISVAFMLTLKGCWCLNLAFNKTAWQVSTFYAGKPEKVIDGKTGSYCHTNAATNPWLIVDLKEVRTIHSVSIFNRGDNCGERLQEFTVEVAMEKPLDNNFNDFSLCSRHSPAVATGAKLILECATPLVGQFVKIQVYASRMPYPICNSYSAFLHICEVEVFAVACDARLDDKIKPYQYKTHVSLCPGGRGGRFSKLKGVRATGTIILQGRVLSTIQCATLCRKNARCSSFNVQKQDCGAVCELLDELDLSNKRNSGTPQVVTGWSHYY